MGDLKGIGKKSRDYLVQVLQGTSGVITSKDLKDSVPNTKGYSTPNL